MTTFVLKTIFVNLFFCFENRRKHLLSSNSPSIFFAIAIAISISSAMPAKAGLITNGGFETTPSLDQVLQPPTVLQGWDVSLNNGGLVTAKGYYYVGDQRVATEGSNRFNMTSASSDYANNSILKTDSSFSALPGEVVTFDYEAICNFSASGRPVGWAKATLKTSVGDIVQVLTDHWHEFYIGWTTVSFFVPPNSIATGLQFETYAEVLPPLPGQINPGWCSVQIGIDNVCVNPVPEPAAFTLLATAVAGGLLWQIRKRKLKSPTAR